MTSARRSGLDFVRRRWTTFSSGLRRDNRADHHSWCVLPTAFRNLTDSLPERLLAESAANICATSRTSEVFTAIGHSERT